MSKDCVPLSHSKVHVMLLDRNYPGVPEADCAVTSARVREKRFNDTLLLPDRVETIHMVPLCGFDQDVSK